MPSVSIASFTRGSQSARTSTSRSAAVRGFSPDPQAGMTAQLRPSPGQ